MTPAHQAPTGVVLAPERRHELVEWAHRVDGFVVEDDYDAEFRYDRQPVGAVQGLAPDRVVAMGSTSKTLSPTLRMGWLVCPPRLHEAVGVEKQLLGRGAPGLDQLALAALVESGGTTGTCARCAASTRAGARHWSRRSPGMRRSRGDGTGRRLPCGAAAPGRRHRGGGGRRAARRTPLRCTG